MSFSNKKLTLIYLAALGAFGPFSTDIYLASMPTIQHSLNTTAAHVQLTLSLFFVGFAMMQLIWGPLSDRIGRKPIVLIGVSLYVISSLACALSTNIITLIVARFFQAAGACAGVLMALAIVKDQFSDAHELTKMLSTMTSVTIIAPMIAPILGGYLLHHLGWRANFYFLAFYGSALIVSTLYTNESHPTHRRKPLPMNKLLSAYKNQITLAPFLLALICVSTNFSVLFAFISSSSFIYIGIYHIAAYKFGYLFAINALALCSGSYVLKKIRHRCHEKNIIFSATALVVLGTTLMSLLIHLYPHAIACVILSSFVVTFGVGLLYPQLMAMALANVIDYTGIASSILGTCRFILAAGIALIMGLLIKTSALPLAFVMFLLNAITIAAMAIYFKHNQN